VRGALLCRRLVVVAHVLSVPVYFVYEVFVRTINKRPQPIPDDLRAVVGDFVADVDLDFVTLCMNAQVPSGHVGITLGRRIFIQGTLDSSKVEDTRLLVHELVHVRQRERFGRLGMMRQYGVEWARILSYVDHPLEVEARRFEERFVSSVSETARLHPSG
jgi:hypothetical protein